MLDIVLLTAALALGQSGTDPGTEPQWRPSPRPAPTLNEGPAARPVLSLDEEPVLLAPLDPLAGARAAAAAEPPPPAPIEITAPLLPPPAPPAPEAPKPAAAALPDRWAFMKAVQGTWLGVGLDDNRIAVYGWTEMAYTASTDRVSNLPDTWNDRANRFLLQQNVIRLERVIDTAAKEPTWGFRIDTLIGSDYRYTLARGLFESQLLNSSGDQNLYGVDPVDFYVNAYFPNLFQGTEVSVGRMLTPISSESELTILTPLLTRSYSFNWGGPFTHTGFMFIPQLTKQLQARLMLTLGNDVFIDPADELRFIGGVTWTSADKKDIVTVQTTLGRGKFNAGEPFAPPTFAAIQEPAGRNNINVFDIIWAHTFSNRLTYQLELLYGYQYGVPTTAAVGAIAGAMISDDRTHGTAHWTAVNQYFTYKWTDKFTTITRVELFDDLEGQRTGFEGLYAGVTTGFQYQFTKALTFRPELRYYNNGYSRPYEGKHDIFDAAADVILRW